MDVSVSTGECTDYRVSSKPGGAPMAPPRPNTGQLGPGEERQLKVSPGQTWTAEFSVDGRVVASAMIDRASSRVVLTKENGVYRVEVT